LFARQRQCDQSAEADFRDGQAIERAEGLPLGGRMSSNPRVYGHRVDNAAGGKHRRLPADQGYFDQLALRLATAWACR